MNLRTYKGFAGTDWYQHASKSQRIFIWVLFCLAIFLSAMFFATLFG
jgi:hypothetical protein